MSVFAIPNPKKTLTVPVNISKIADLIQTIPVVEKSYKFTKGNDTFKIYTLEAYEFLSLGIFADFSLNELSPDKTEITLEIRRKVGSFNQSHEITNANEHLDRLIDTLANVSVMSDSQIEELKQKSIEVIQKKKDRADNVKKLDGKVLKYLKIALCIIIWPIGLIVLGKKIQEKYVPA